MSASDALFTLEFIDRLKKRDERFVALETYIKLETELKDSLALKLVLEQVGEQAAEALEQLAEVSPSDTKKIVELQAKVYRARFIHRSLNDAIEMGKIAEKSLSEDQRIDLIPEDDNYAN